MKTKDLFCEIIDLLLTSDESFADWVKVPRLRNSCILIAVLSLIAFFISFILFPLFVNANANAVFIFRSCQLFVWLLLVTAFFILNFNYFQYILTKHYPIRLDNVIFFYFIHIIIFGYIYSSIYFLFPDFYIYKDPPVKPSQELLISFKVTLGRLNFLLFSALQSVNATFYRISLNSIIPSILSWVQSLYSFAIIALLIASYVNQKVHPITEKDNDYSAKRITSADTKNSGDSQ